MIYLQPLNLLYCCMHVLVCIERTEWSEYCRRKAWIDKTPRAVWPFRALICLLWSSNIISDALNGDAAMGLLQISKWPSMLHMKQYTTKHGYPALKTCVPLFTIVMILCMCRYILSLIVACRVWSNWTEHITECEAVLLWSFWISSVWCYSSRTLYRKWENF